MWYPVATWTWTTSKVWWNARCSEQQRRPCKGPPGRYEDYEAELRIVSLWGLFEALKVRLGHELKISSNRWLYGLSSKPRPKDRSWTWDAPAEDAWDNYVQSEHTSMEEPNVLMFDEEADKEATLGCDLEIRPMSDKSAMLDGRPDIEEIMVEECNEGKLLNIRPLTQEAIMDQGYNKGTFRNSRLLTREAFQLVRQRFS